MGLLFESCIMNILSIIIALFCILIAYFKYKFTYWARKGVAFLPPEIPYGNAKEVILQKLSVGEYIRDLYTHFKSKGFRYAGCYTFYIPEIIILDPELSKNILIRDFSYFSDRGGFQADEENEPITAHLLSLSGNKWRNMRKLLTPTFTSGKMKMMFHIIVACADELEDVINEYVKKNETIEVKSILARFTTDIIGSCAYGLECNSLKNANSDFRINGQKAITTLNTFKRLFVTLFPKIFTLLKFRQIDPELHEFFIKLVEKTIAYREKNNVKRNDFLQLLINLKNTGDVDGQKDSSLETQGLNIGQIAAQCFLFFLAGFETSSNAMTFFLYDVAQNQDIQDKVRKEINDTLKKHDGKISYQGVMEMQYLDMALSESMRLHPSVGSIQRLCTKDYKIPDSDVIIEKGTSVNFPVLGMQHDPDYYPDPLKFDPERFSPGEKEKRPTATYLPFGEGPKNCIGQRFGLLQTKVGIVTLLKNHRYTLNSKTQVPYKLNPKELLYNTIGGTYLDIERI